MSSSIVAAVAVHRFASDDSNLRLPAGNVRALESGRVFSIGGWIIAVGISPTVFLAAQPRLQPTGFSTLLEQSVGFLVGRGAHVLRLDIRFPEAWHKSGNLRGTVTFWAQEFLRFGRDRRLFIALPPRLNPNVFLPIVSAADTAMRFWQEVHLLMTALGAEHPESASRIRIQLWDLARDWEIQWNRAIAVTEEHEDTYAASRELIYAADCAWAHIVREHLEPCGYRMEPNSIARLL
jgi:hypothetical protein